MSFDMCPINYCELAYKLALLYCRVCTTKKFLLVAIYLLFCNTYNHKYYISTRYESAIEFQCCFI